MFNAAQYKWSRYVEDCWSVFFEGGDEFGRDSTHVAKQWTVQLSNGGKWRQLCEYV